MLCVISPGSFAQSDDASGPLSLSAYIETFYTNDFANPPDQTRPDFFCSYHRHNEVNLNLGFVKACYETGKMGATLALMAGTYANANLAKEPGVLKNIF